MVVYTWKPKLDMVVHPGTQAGHGGVHPET